MSKSYSRLKKRILAGAAGSVMAGALFLGSSVYAETVDYQPRISKESPLHTMHRWNSRSRAVALGLNRRYIKNQLKSGKTMKQILLESGIDTKNLNKV